MGLLYFSIVAQERADRQEITIALRLSLQRNALSYCHECHVYLSVHYYL